MKCPFCKKWWVDEKRTSRQNSAMHIYFQMVAEELGNSGVDMRHFFSEGIELRWTPHSVKEYIWRRIQEALYGKKSTTSLTRDEVNKIYEVMAKVLAEKAQVSIPFPSKEELEKEIWN